MKYEFADASTYKLILEAIANGKAKLNEIKDFIKVKRTDISPYLRNLIEVRMIKREVPVTESINSILGRYFLADNFLKFWFRFVYPRLSAIEEGIFGVKGIKSSYPAYLGGIFEGIVKEFLIKNSEKYFPCTKIGRWWFKGEEIDLVALSEEESRILFTECKWQDKVDARKVLSDLRNKAKLVQWRNGKRKEQFAIFAKSFREKIKEEGVMLFDMEDMDSA